jgi:hypothetical protein
LGALLYELLTGTVPLPKTQPSGTGWLEIERTILEDVPVRPSRRLAGLEAARAAFTRTAAALAELEEQTVASMRELLEGNRTAEGLLLTDLVPPSGIIW